MSPEEYKSGAGFGGGDFNTTHWSAVFLAGQSQAPGAGTALENLCRTYWPPLYAYVRRQGHSPHDAQDLTQDFFARLLEKKYLRLASEEHGRFRSFLLKSMKHFLINEWKRGGSQKRGAGQVVISFDKESAERSYLQQPAEGLTPEHLFEKHWAMTLLEQAMERLGSDYSAAGKGALFGQLKDFLLTEGTGEAYHGIADLLGLTAGAVKVAVHRLRQRFRETVRTEIARTVSTPAEVDEELRALIAAMIS
ncbi:MAG: hypothetical protein JWM59_4377 [Verrucomicrobiales bacterium]|nr:hypothetical protein [Verrucomicrobiales bacterium]